VVKRLEFQVENEEELYLTVTASYKAMSEAWSITNGTDGEKEFFNKAMDSLINETSQKMGRIDDMMKEFENVINGIDLEDAAHQQEGLDQIRAWEAEFNPKLNDDIKAIEGATEQDEFLHAAQAAMKETLGKGDEVVVEQSAGGATATSGKYF